MKSTQSSLSRSEFERLVSAHHDAVYASALRIVREAALALDVTQDVYLALLSGRIVLSGADDERVLRWFAIRTALQSLRSGVHRRAREEEYAMQHRDAHEDTNVETRDTTGVLMRFVERLPDELRTAIHLRFHEGLTFAKMGEALAISEPSAHDRVKRALGRLREGLSRAGLAGLALDVESELITAARSAPAAPPLVAQKLVALQSGVKAVSLTAVVLSSVVLVAASVLVLPSLFGEKPGEVVFYSDDHGYADHADGTPLAASGWPSRSATRESAVTPTSGAPAAAKAESSAGEGQAQIVGRVVDPEHRPVGGLVVSASSTEFQGKFPRYVGRAETLADGSFTISVPVGTTGERSYVLALDGRVAFEREPRAELVTVKDKSTAPVGTLRMHPVPRDEEGFFEHEITIVGTDGRPLSGIRVTLFRAVRSPEGWSDETWEVGVTSTVSGIARLEAAHVGDKVLLIDGREQGYRRLRLARRIEAGFSKERLVLERGLEIRGRLVDVEGRAVVPRSTNMFGGMDLQLHAVSPAEPNEWIFAQIDAGGSFVIAGLDDRDHQLDIAGGPWSRICRDGVRPGGADLVLTLKRRDDPRDVGDHCAEIHVTIVAAATNEPVRVDVLCGDVQLLPEGTTAQQFAADLAPGMLVKPSVQVAWFGEYPAPSDRQRETGLAAGTYAYILRTAGYAPEMIAPIVLAEREVASDLVVALVRPTSVRGHVLDSDGKPLAGSFVFVSGSGPNSLARRTAITDEIARTNGRPSRNDLVRVAADGSFEIAGLSPRFEYTVWAVHEDRRPVASPRLDGRAPGTVELRFER